jgi:folate-dependent phosphoribosylglycinamide formyltransferase PurN
MTIKITIEHNGVKFRCSPRQAASIETLMDTNGGGFAVIHDYVSTSNRTTPEVADINFISRFSTEKLYKRRIAAIETVTLPEVISDLAANPKVSSAPLDTIQKAFDERKAKLIEGCQKTLDGDRNDAHREAHDACYHTLVPGVKVHFVTAENAEGHKRPVLDNGIPVVDAIMLTVIQVSKTVKTPGVYKTVNSGLPVLIGNAIERLLPKSVKIKAVKLAEGKFSSLSIGKVDMLPESFRGL